MAEEKGLIVSQSAHNPFCLNGRVVLLTGATGHLGWEIAKGLATLGAIMVLNGRDENKLRELTGELGPGTEYLTVAADITATSGRASVLRAIQGRYGRVDCIINNAYAGKAAELTEATEEDFEQSYRYNVVAPYFLVVKGLALLKSGVQKNGDASVVNIASMYASVSPDPAVYLSGVGNNPPFYGAAKAGMLQLTRYLAAYLAPYRIRVNSISPGPFPAPEVQTVHADFIEALSKKVPLGRVGAPNELVGAVALLASDASSYITGANLPVDGGWTAW